jgi:hypothetical protein
VYRGKSVAQKFALLLYLSKTAQVVNKCPSGENSHNLVTLFKPFLCINGTVDPTYVRTDWSQLGVCQYLHRYGVRCKKIDRVSYSIVRYLGLWQWWLFFDILITFRLKNIDFLKKLCYCYFSVLNGCILSRNWKYFCFFVKMFTNQNIGPCTPKYTKMYVHKKTVCTYR